MCKGLFLSLTQLNVFAYVSLLLITYKCLHKTSLAQSKVRYSGKGKYNKYVINIYNVYKVYIYIYIYIYMIHIYYILLYYIYVILYYIIFYYILYDIIYIIQNEENSILFTTPPFQEVAMSKFN